MKRLLHIIASPRGDESRTSAVSAAFLEAFRAHNPACEVDELNVATEPLPPLSIPMISGKYVLLSGGQLTDRLREAWAPIERHIGRFLAAEGYLLSTPMWNFNIPYTLKHYIDLIVQPKYLFRYTAKGVEGLAAGRKMVVVASRGGAYPPGTPMASFDHQEPYLRTIFGFVGIKDITFVLAQPMDAGGEKLRNRALESAKAAARRAAEAFAPQLAA
ncbi:MAG: NAD(P)H-dependent oxidoreductase [Elusimicrobia bacterium]|nr:NAD(P)H-dependent oxidoreductase [Elusimicrobiota bacterium]